VNEEAGNSAKLFPKGINMVLQGHNAVGITCKDGMLRQKSSLRVRFLPDK
jgi:hypothetical protein